jgi:hypothetical protein
MTSLAAGAEAPVGDPRGLTRKSRAALEIKSPHCRWGPHADNLILTMGQRSQGTLQAVSRVSLSNAAALLLLSSQPASARAQGSKLSRPVDLPSATPVLPKLHQPALRLHSIWYRRGGLATCPGQLASQLALVLPGQPRHLVQVFPRLLPLWLVLVFLGQPSS